MPSQCSWRLSLLKSCFFIIYLGSVIEAANESIQIGALIDVDTRIGKEQKTAMMIAAANFNSMSRNHKLSIHFWNISKDPVQAISGAEELIREKQVQVIIGLQTWEQATLVADVGKRAQVPVLSLAAASNPYFMKLRWPFLIPMASNSWEQMKCMSAVVGSFNWRKVIAIYEEDAYGGDSGMLTLLSRALQDVDAEVDSYLALPLASSLFDSEIIVREEVKKLLRKQSRVFIVLRSSLSVATQLFKEAKSIGLMDRDSVWIIADTLSDLLDSVDTSLISSLQGALGVKNYYSENTRPFLDFKSQFQRNFRLEFPDEDNMEPGIHALRAYDGITAISKAVETLGSNSTRPSTALLSKILSINFTGLTGDIQFHGEAPSNISIFRVVNVVGKRYKELGFWSLSFGFAEKSEFENGKMKLSIVERVNSMEKLSALVNWPGELNRTPKGWAMPTVEEPMKIGIPGRTSFEKFVKVDWELDKSDKRRYDGFCIDLFEEVLKIVEQDQHYTLPYEFEPYNVSYDALIDLVINKTFDAVVGDITILANRTSYVEFTLPFAESGLSMVVPVKREAQKPWIFLRPLTPNMWISTCAILFYTMFVVWFIEHHQPNPAFRGPWKEQLGTSLWFTFCSLFFAQREKIISNYSKMVVVVWLFLVFVLTQSYTASLTSMLLVPRLRPNVTDIDWISKTNASVGCDGDSFVVTFVRDVIKLQNIKTIGNEDDYPGEFQSGNIAAAFLELPYEKVFLKEHCNDYTAAGPTYRFGGQGFVFQKGSPIAHDFSKAILTLLENGKLKRLEDEWFGTSMDCSNSEDSLQTQNLHFGSFWGLFLMSSATSTISFLIVLIRIVKISKKKDGTLNKLVQLGRLLPNGTSTALPTRRTLSRRLRSSQSTQRDLVSPSDHSEYCDTPQHNEVGILVKDN